MAMAAASATSYLATIIMILIASSSFVNPTSAVRRFGSIQSVTAKPDRFRPSISTGTGTGTDPDLEFYVQVDTDSLDLAVLLDAVDTNTSASFGQIQAFALNVTSGADASSSQLLGVMHGYTVQTSYTSSVSRAVEVEVLSYDDGAGVNGTMSIQGLIGNSESTISVLGGTGSFAGVRGYDEVTFYSAVSDTLFVYHHSIYFL